MNSEVLTENWALWVAVVPALIAGQYVIRYLIRRTARGQLRQADKRHKQVSKAFANAKRFRAKAEARVEKLSGAASHVKPRVLQEAREALDDAIALQKIADDKLQVQANHVRRVIFEEFPPARHDKLRAQYLPQDVKDGRPFSF